MTAGAYGISICIGLMLKEPPLKTHSLQHTKRLRTAVHHVVSNKPFFIRLVYFAILGSCTHLAWLLLQLHYLDPHVLKYIIAAYFFFFGLGSVLAHYFRLTAERVIAFLAILSTAVRFFVTAHANAYAGFLATLFFSFFAGCAYVLLEQRIQQLTTSTHRATVSSLINLGKSIVYMIFSLILGYFAKHFSPIFAFSFLGALLLIVMVFIIP